MMMLMMSNNPQNITNPLDTATMATRCAAPINAPTKAAFQALTP